MDVPLRTRLQLSFFAVALLSGLLTVGVGSLLQVMQLRELRASATAGDAFAAQQIAEQRAQAQQTTGLLLAAAAVGLVAAWAMGTYLAGRLTRRLDQLTGAALALEHGELDARVPCPESAQQDELKRLQVIFNEMAEALQHHEEELRESREQLAQWNENYLSTLAFITHELKNQIASTRLNLLALRDGYLGTLSDEQHEAVDDVMVTVNRTEEMLLNYLNLSRIEKGELVVRERPVAVRSEAVEPVLRHLQPQVADREMRVEVDMPEDLMAQADPTLLQTVYENLLTNALKYGRRGGQIRVTGRALNGMAEYHVWNEGPGVAPENLGQLFGKFSRLAPPGEQERGTGLGLFIDREIVRLHGGAIRAESQYGEWIDFIFTLPRPDEMLELPHAIT